MASPGPAPLSTGVVALDSARRTLSIIIADRATDIPYSADALSRLTKLLPMNIRTFDNMNQVSEVAEHLLCRRPTDKGNQVYIDNEACRLYQTIAVGLHKLHIREEIYRVIFEKKGRVLVNHKMRGERLLKVEGDIERLLGIILEMEREKQESSQNAAEGGGEGEGAPEEDIKVKIEGSGEGEDVGVAGSYKCEHDVFVKLEEA